MSAPVLWIFFPLLTSSILLLFRERRWIVYSASAFTFLLALIAWLLPIDTVFQIGNLSFKLNPSFSMLGRRLILTQSDQPLLSLIYGSTLFWFIASGSIRVERRLIPLGLTITAMLVASLAVEPFLYAALFIEMAVLISVPLLLPEKQMPGRGLIRFVIFQTLAIPFILFSGWQLAGIEANPGNLSLVLQAAILLGLGFSFLLAVFPFYTWIPLLVEEAHPFIVGFVLWIFPTLALLFGMSLIDRYTWLRISPNLPNIFQLVGVLMIVSGGLSAAFQRHLGRIFGYAIIIETGYSLLAISISQTTSLNLFFLLLIPRLISISVWVFSLSILKEKAQSLLLNEIQGFGRILPIIAIGIFIANLTLAGLPLLASFPAHFGIWNQLAEHSLTSAFWALIGSAGMFFAAIRTLIALLKHQEEKNWEIHETRVQRLLLGLGLLALFTMGIFPQWTTNFFTKVPSIFEYLGH